MSKILCSTGCLIGRPNGRNYHLIREFVKELNYDGMEFMMYSDWYPEVDALLEELLALPVQFPVRQLVSGVRRTGRMLFQDLRLIARLRRKSEHVRW